jgi:hypothetical protein
MFTTLITAGGGGAIVAFALFRWLGTTWLETKFSERLEAFRHEKAKELERLRADIDGSLQVRLRFQERQFESTVVVWDALKSTQVKMVSCLSPLQQYSNISQMDDDARAEYLSSFDLQKWQEREILGASDAQEIFMKMVDRKRFGEAAKAFSEFDQIVRSKELFFNLEVYAILRSITDEMHNALITKEMALDDPDRRLSREAWDIYEKKCNPKIGEFSAIGRTLLSEP